MKDRRYAALMAIGLLRLSGLAQAKSRTEMPPFGKKTSAPVSRIKDARVHDPSVTDVSGPVRFYPALSGDLSNESPIVKIRDAKSAGLGVDARIGWREDAIWFVFEVQDPKAGDTVAGAAMWTGDSVQLAVDTQPDKAKNRYTESCYELGFAFTSAGEVIHYAWQSGGRGEFDWKSVEARGKRTATGYQIEVSIPWKNLGINPKTLPERLGVDVLVNDVGTTGQRRFVEWTPGIGLTKDPSQLKRVTLVDGRGTNSVACLTVDRLLYKHDESIAGAYEEYALAHLPDSKLDLVVRGGGRTFGVGTATLPEVTAGSVRQVHFDFPGEALANGSYRLSVEAAKAPSQELAWASFDRQDLGTQVQARLKEAQAHFARIKSSLSATPGLARDDYVRLGIAIAERFIRRVETGNQTLDWAWLQINEVREVLDQTEAGIKRAAGRPVQQLVPRPTGGPVILRDGIFCSDTTVGKGSPPVQRPCYFSGYGVFGQVAADIPNFQDLGVNLVSQERGPSSMNPDGSLNDSGHSILKVLRSAARNGIKVDLLLSPHYLPQWALDQSPDMVPKDYVGFPSFHLDHPKAREVIQKWLEAVVPAVKDEPALFSLCLANEPENHNGGRDPYSRPQWIEYLRWHHQTIESLNGLYSTNYKSFEEVPPGTQAVVEVGSKRAYYDWVRFNQDHFADWFRWMNGIIKGLAPDVPTHIKALSNFFLFRLVHTGVDPELLCEVTDLAGNDCVSLPADSTYDVRWEEFWYDLLHSFRGQPVFNSENHFITDDSPAVSLPPNHIRSVLWQGALHHQGATTLWVWEEPAIEPLKGSIYLRPANMYSAGRTMLDLNRLAPAVAAVSQAKPKVALLYSMPSYFWQDDYIEVMKKLYSALILLGQPVTFVSERQLAEGRAAKVDWIFLPHATHVHDATVAALEKFASRGGRVVRAGKDCLVYDEYHRQRTLSPESGSVSQIDVTANEQQVRASVRYILANGGLNLVTLRNVGDGKLGGGVEYRAVPYHDGMLAPMINLLQQPQRVRLSLQGSATDLLSGDAVNLDQIRLEPMQPRLLWVPRTVLKAMNAPMATGRH